METRPFEINGRPVGSGAPCFVIAEAGVNHNGDLGMARRLIDAARAAGADAVKFQTFRTDLLVTADARKAEYQRANTGEAGGQREMLRKLELSETDHHALLEHARASGVLLLSTPFDEPSARLLADLGLPVLKISSGEVTNLPFLARLAQMNLPLILSTGMSDLDEVAGAVRAIRENGNPPLALLHCVSNYPAAPGDVNLRAMATMRAEFGVPVGYSDHAEDNEVALAAVALGASILEKHLTLDRTLPGPDHRASSEPAEFATLVRGVRTVESALGSGRKVPAPSERAVAAVARRSLVAARDLPAGSTIELDAVAVRRPGSGLPPSSLPEILGRRLRAAVKSGEVLQRDHIA